MLRSIFDDRQQNSPNIQKEQLILEAHPTFENYLETNEKPESDHEIKSSDYIVGHNRQQTVPIQALSDPSSDDEIPSSSFISRKGTVLGSMNSMDKKDRFPIIQLKNLESLSYNDRKVHR